jgi:hypothetical protein
MVDKRAQPLPPFEQVKPQLNNLVLRDEEQKVVENLRKDAKIERFNADGTPVVDKPAATDAPATPAPAPAAPAPAAPAPAPAASPAPAAAPKK